MGTETGRTATADKGRPHTGVVTPMADASHGYTARLLKRLVEYRTKGGTATSKELFSIGLNIRADPEIVHLLRQLVGHHHHSHLTGGKLLIIVKDDNPSVGYSISGVEAKDAEGNVIPDAQLTYEVTSTDDSVVSIAPTDDKTGTVSFGNPGIATVNVQVSTNGTLLGSFAQPFTVTTGDPASISGGSIAFDGLTDQP